MLRVNWANEQFELLGERAIFWPRESALIITDPHFGKAATFRRAGIPVPAGTTHSMLRRMDAVIAQTAARQLIILGDFFHAREGRSPQCMNLLDRWFAAPPVQNCVLVRGNHDRHAGDPPSEWHIQCVDHLNISDAFTFTHHPPAAKRPRAMAGHIHPLACMVDAIGETLRSPCFAFSDHLALLPAFGDFVGGCGISATRDMRIFPVADGCVAEATLA